jgi:hypothetical protein
MLDCWPHVFCFVEIRISSPAPKTRWKLGTVLCDTGQGGRSLAEGEWDDDSTLGIRSEAFLISLGGKSS